MALYDVLRSGRPRRRRDRRLSVAASEDASVARRRRRQRTGRRGGAGGGAPRSDPAPQHAVPHPRRTRDPRRRVRPLGPGAAPPRVEYPVLATPDSPTNSVGAAPSGLFQEVRHRAPMMSLDNAFSDDEVRGVGRPPPTAGPLARTRVPRVHLRAEGRRRGHVAHVRAGPLRPGRHARRRCRGRGRDGERRHREGRAARAGPSGRAVPRRARGARRNLHAGRRVRCDEQASGGRGRATVRQPSQFCGRRAAPEGSGRHRTVVRCTSGPTRSASSRARRPRARGRPRRRLRRWPN